MSEDDEDVWYLLSPVRSGMRGVVPPPPMVISEDDLIAKGIPEASLWGHWVAYRIQGDQLQLVRVTEERTVRYQIVEP